MKSNRLIILIIIILFMGCNLFNDTDSETVDETPKDSLTDTSDDTPKKNPISGDFTYKLTESSSSLPLWTLPVTQKVQTSDNIPSRSSSGIAVCAAKGEFEPFQIVIGKSSGSVTLSIDNFSGLGTDQRVTLSKVGFEEGWAETLTPLSDGETVTLSSSQPTPIWGTIFVPRDAPAGNHTTPLKISHDGKDIVIPIELKVFDFTIPEEIHFASQFNYSIKGEEDHTLLYEHRLTPKSPTWPSGFSYKITWPSPYTTFYDEADQGEKWGIKYLAQKYIHGEGWKGSGYPNAMAFQFVNNSTPRPETFAGVSRGSTHYGTTAYNNEWKKYLAALNSYLVANTYSDEVYYYVMNEPQNEADYELAAFLAKLTKEAAPDLRIAVSEEAKPEIAENSTYTTPDGSSYDIWIAEVQHYKQEYAWKRNREYGEETWFYSLPQDPPPFFNPTRVDRQGMNQRIIPWTAWYHRVRGWAYYNGAEFFDNGKANIRLELLREGFEDYEYLYRANNKQHPKTDVSNSIDPLVESVTTGATSWTQNADALMSLKWKLGAYIEGSLDTLPLLETEVKRPKGEYYINFQDPKGEPTASPLTIDGNTYIKIGWTEYNENDLYGFTGFAIEHPEVQKYNYRAESGFSEVQKSYLYDDYGKINTFEFDLENGLYDVTLGIGRPNKPTNDKQNVTVEGVTYYNYVANLSSDEKVHTIEISDGKLTVVFGDAVGEYTFLAYLKIVPHK